MVYGVWCMVYGVYCIMYSVWCIVLESLSYFLFRAGITEPIQVKMKNDKKGMDYNLQNSRYSAKLTRPISYYQN